MRKYIGTSELIGAVLVEDKYDEFIFEKNGRRFTLVREEEWNDTCFCEGECSCSPSVYMRAYEIDE